MTAPTVSIVLPVYNGGAALALALESIYRQTFRSWELVLIDDGSHDGSLAKMRLGDERVRLVQDGKNLGLAMRLNQGIELARGRYLARMDHDDLAYPRRLQAQVEFLDGHPDVDLVGTRAMVFGEHGDALGLFPFRRTHAEICAAPWRGFYLPHPTWMGRIEWFRRHRYRMPEAVRAEDQELLLRAYRDSRFACLPEVLMGYRQAGLPLGKILTARRSLAQAQWSVHRAQGRPVQAALGFVAFGLKAAIDAALGAIGASRLFTSRMARPAPADEIARWKTVWEETLRACAAPSSNGGAVR